MSFVQITEVMASGVVFQQPLGLMALYVYSYALNIHFSVLKIKTIVSLREKAALQILVMY